MLIIGEHSDLNAPGLMFTGRRTIKILLAFGGELCPHLASEVVVILKIIIFVLPG